MKSLSIGGSLESIHIHININININQVDDNDPQ